MGNYGLVRIKYKVISVKIEFSHDLTKNVKFLITINLHVNRQHDIWYNSYVAMLKILWNYHSDLFLKNQITLIVLRV